MSSAQAVPASAAGPCTTRTSADRSTIQLVDAAGQNRSHVSLGRDRVQKTYSSPDGAWEIVVFKVRGEQVFGAIAIDLRGCQAGESTDLPALPEDVSFSGEEATLLGPGGATKRILLTRKAR